MDPRDMPPASPAYAEADEAALLAGLRAGDGAAFAALVRASGGRLLTTARRFLRHEEDARDVVQEALLAAFKAIPGFDGRSRLATWLHRITVNAALQKLRSRRRQEQPIEPLLPRFLPDGHQADPAAEWPEPADAVLQRRELFALVHACIDRLPEAYRSVLLLRDIEELDTEETARLLGVSPGVVKTRLHRARQALRVLLDPHMRGDAS